MSSLRGAAGPYGSVSMRAPSRDSVPENRDDRIGFRCASDVKPSDTVHTATVRSGGYASTPGGLRPGSRMGYSLGYSSHLLGFRCASDAPPSVPKHTAITRGGSWYFLPIILRTAYRDFTLSPDFQRSSLGFRCAKGR